MLEEGGRTRDMKQGIVLPSLVAAGVFIMLTNFGYQESAATMSKAQTFSSAPHPSPATKVINAKFVVSAIQVRKAFDEYELKGEKNLKVSVGEDHSLGVTAQGPFNPQSLTLSVNFLSSVDQARKFGYEFGLVAKNRTPADRKDFEDRLVGRILEQSNQAAFIVKLLPVPSPDLNVPSISFALLDQNGQSINASTQPSDYSASPLDLFAAVALEQDGQELIFPVTSGSVPLITNKMDKMTLVVDVDGQQRKFDYSLKP